MRIEIDRSGMARVIRLLRDDGVLVDTFSALEAGGASWERMVDALADEVESSARQLAIAKDELNACRRALDIATTQIEMPEPTVREASAVLRALGTFNDALDRGELPARMIGSTLAEMIAAAQRVMRVMS